MCQVRFQIGDRSVSRKYIHIRRRASVYWFGGPCTQRWTLHWCNAWVRNHIGCCCPIIELAVGGYVPCYQRSIGLHEHAICRYSHLGDPLWCMPIQWVCSSLFSYLNGIHQRQLVDQSGSLVSTPY